MQAANLPTGQVWTLPPVILHPFSDPGGPDKLVESSRAHLMMQGLLPTGELSPEEVLHRLLAGRLCELRMLFYVGKDLQRWVDQCAELAERDPVLRAAGVTGASFVQLLVERPPADVVEKLTKWGVADYKSIFSRALGLIAVFSKAPDLENLSTHFVRYYYRYADQMYTCRQNADTFAGLRPENFSFELFASGEYSRMLEREWEEI
ncbi:MAG: hypothetical protein HY858_00950 [Candidatus Solibacter usitatus]|nr:hypothetical protein [Candidatus Solibacter usitatus]